MKQKVSLILLLIVLAFLFAFTFYCFFILFLKLDIASIGASISAFMGAFFAFLFIRLGEALTRFYDRQVKHYNALVELEQACGRYLNEISDNIFVINDCIKIANDNKGSLFFFANRLDVFSIDNSLTLCLHNVDLVNEVFSYNIDMDKLNKSIEPVNRHYDDIKNNFLKKSINADTYLANVQIYLEKLVELRGFLTKLEEKTKKLAVLSRILLRDKPFLTWLIQIISKTRLTDRIKKQVPDELKKFEVEIDEGKKQSREEIQKVQEIIEVLRKTD